MDAMTNAEKALQYFVIAVPEDKEQAEAYFWARRALNAAIWVERAAVEPVSMLTNADRIRAMSDEELAKWLEYEGGGACSEVCGWLERLRQSASEG